MPPLERILGPVEVLAIMGSRAPYSAACATCTHKRSLLELRKAIFFSEICAFQSRAARDRREFMKFEFMDTACRNERQEA